jgi:hypothetical protein
MKTIIETFYKLQQENPSLGDYIILTKVISGNNYHEATISKLFSKLIPKEDYERGDRSLFIKHLVKLSKTNV